uniref:ABC transmembrane type-1 domain-containing protein n=1 Tax=Syphacia muris TaxID=451379 RepID=A0A0N5AKW1_9BILA
MPAAILPLLSVYVGTIVGIVVATICLIFAGYGWGPLPHLYLQLVTFLQSFYPHAYPRAEARWPSIIRHSGRSALEKHRNDSLSSFKFRYV